MASTNARTTGADKARVKMTLASRPTPVLATPVKTSTTNNESATNTPDLGRRPAARWGQGGTGGGDFGSRSDMQISVLVRGKQPIWQPPVVGPHGLLLAVESHEALDRVGDL